MKTNLIKLRLIDRMVVSIDNFYSITISEYDIKLQGGYDSKITLKLNKLFHFTIDSNGYMSGTKGNVNITLT